MSSVLGDICELKRKINFHYKWNIQNFTGALTEQDTIYSPELTVRDLEFRLKLQLDKEKSGYNIWLENLSKQAVRFDLLELSLIGKDGSIKTIGQKNNVEFNEGQQFLDEDSADGCFSRKELVARFIINANLSLDLVVTSEEGEAYLEEIFKGAGTAFTDVTFSCSGEQFHAHRFILASRSSVFRTMFTNNGNAEAQIRTMEIDDMKPEALQALLAFIYQGRINNDVITVDLLTADDKYKLPDLVKKREQHLYAIIGLDNSAQLYISSFQHLTKQLKEVCMRFIADKYEAVRNSEAMKVIKANPDAMAELIQFILN